MDFLWKCKLTSQSDISFLIPILIFHSYCMIKSVLTQLLKICPFFLQYVDSSFWSLLFPFNLYGSLSLWAFSPSLSFSLSLPVDTDEIGTCLYLSAWAESAPRKVESRGASERIREEEGKKHKLFACSHCPVWFCTCLLLCWW